MEDQPSLRDLGQADDEPGIEMPGYCRVSLRDRVLAAKVTSCVFIS